MPDRVFLFMLTISKIRLRLLIVLSAFTTACGGSSATHVNPEPDPRVLPAVGEQAPDISELYRQIGLIAAPNPVAFVGKISAFASKTPDTTLLLVSISLPNRALTFSREGDRYRAPYEVNLALSRGNVDAGSVNAMEIVRVGSFREINRSDESVIFQHYFHLPPGLYSLSATVRDVGGSRTATQQVSVSVPALGSGGLSTPLLVYEAKGRSVLDSAPNVLASPRSSAVFGRDSTVAVYVEGYGSGARLPVDFIVRNDKGEQIWRDSVQLTRNGALFSGIVSVPISTVGVGTAQVSFTRRDVPDSVQAPLFVSFGEDIPLMSFEDMLQYLRFFASASRLNALRSAPPEKRATMWAEFLRATDPIPETATNEDMQAYFSRIHVANLQFRTEHNPGWLSGRGMVYVALGEPDQITERNVNQSVTTMQMGATTRLQIWQYRQLNSQLVFYDETGRWKLTRPSETDFITLNARRAR
jgi:GWxTD domain-containing protein